MSEVQEIPILYNYHPQTKEFLSIGKADKSPAHDSEWIYPAFSTLIAPPEIGANQAAIFEQIDNDMFNGTWSLVVDHRGETWYDENGAEIIIDFLGNPLEKGLIQEKPPEPEKPIIYPDLTARQIRLGLNKNGWLDKVQPLIDSLPDDTKTNAQIEWDYATSFSRDHWLIAQIATTLKISDDILNDKWLEFSMI